MSAQPFQIPYSDALIRDLRERLARTRWPGLGPDEHGFPLDYLRDLCGYWKDRFDWKMQIQRFSAFQHYRTSIDGLGIHFIHAPGNGPAPIPLVLTHGWPGSFLEMLKIIPLLTDPAGHGGAAADAFHVVIPSLPGFGFSDKPSQPGMNVERIAGLWVQLMQELGYHRFAAQGGDFGAGVSTFLGLRHPERLLGIHLNYIPGSYRPDLSAGPVISAVEQASLDDADRWYQESGAYAHLQRNEPLTAAYALNDSPAALAAWIIDKFRAWADCGGEVESKFTRDELLSNVTLYWMTETIYSSFRLYYETKRAPVQFGAGDFVRVPCAIAHFPKEEPFPARAWIERGYNIARWTDMPSGGHFAAAEEPELLAEDIRAFFRAFR